MNPVAELPLRDIHLPDSVSWWPPAVGWWLLPVLLIVLIYLIIMVVRKLRQPVLKKSARAEIDAVIANYRQHGDRLLLVQELSIALRRIGISYLPRNSVAGEVGRAWYEQLNQLVDKNRLSPECIRLLSESAYQKQPQISAEQVESAINQVSGWVAALSRSRPHV